MRGMRSNWFGGNLKCVIMCGGEGSRLFPVTLEKQKTMIEIGGQPLLKTVIDYWSRYTNDFIFVVKYKKQELMDYVKTLPIRSTFVEPNELNGLADGLLYVESFIENNFIVVLGDCVCVGDFNFPESFSQGFGVVETEEKDDIFRSFSVELDGEHARRVVEKPKKLVNNLCGMGFYFFNKVVFDYIRQTEPSVLTNKIELTDTIQKMISSGEKVHPVHFKGSYLNVTYPSDLELAREILSKKEL